MCVLYACIKGKPTLQTLKDNQYMNDDGNGYSWVDRGKVRWRKGILTATELHDQIEHLPLPIMIHQRMRSAGTIHLGLTHPFPIHGKASLALKGVAQEVMAHNGTIDNWSQYLTIAKTKFGLRVRKNEPWSDTRLLAWLLGRMDKEAVLEMLAPGQKIALMDTQGIRIINPNSWWKAPHENNGYWQSADYSSFGYGYGCSSFKWNKGSESYDWESYWEDRYDRNLEKYSKVVEKTKDDRDWDTDKEWPSVVRNAMVVHGD